MTAEFTVGQSVGDYEVLSILGLGGMGKVYKVRNVISDRAGGDEGLAAGPDCAPEPR